MFLRVIGGILALFALGTIPLGIHTVSEGASVLLIKQAFRSTPPRLPLRACRSVLARRSLAEPSNHARFQPESALPRLVRAACCLPVSVVLDAEVALYHLRMEQVQVTIQTDSVRNIPCGTSGGVLLSFDRVEVVNRLRKEHVLETVRNYTVHYDRPIIFDRVHHELNQFCSSHSLREVYITKFDTLDEALQAALQQGASEWAPGVEIISVRVTKPRIPAQIKENFERMEAEKTQLLIATEVQRVREMEAQTEKLLATLSAQKDANVSRVHMLRKLEEKEAGRKMADISNAMHVDRERALADAEHYKSMKEAEANAKRLTPAFLEFTKIRSVANVSKVFFGPSIPDMYVEQSSPSPPLAQAQAQHNAAPRHGSVHQGGAAPARNRAAGVYEVGADGEVDLS